MFDIEFWRNFLSNALATFVGVIIGIPVALWINRIQQKLSEKTEAERLEADADTRKRKILQLIKDELMNDRDLLTRIREDKNTHIDDEVINTEDLLVDKIKTVDDVYQLRTELWKAFSDGGEIQWIRNLDLLQSIAVTYERIGMIIYSYETLQYQHSSSSDVLEYGRTWTSAYRLAACSPMPENWTCRGCT